jgi:hypothetical protein
VKVKSRVAVELEEEVMVRLDGTITTNKDEQAGRKTKYILTRPEFIFFVDEVGCNTSQKNDGNNWGQNFIVQSGQLALLRASFTDRHFTVLGFTNGNGDPVLAFSAGNVCLSDGKIHEKVREQYNNRQQKILDAERKRKEEFEKLCTKVVAIRMKSSDPSKWNASELQTMVSWFKRPGDSKLPQ